MNKIFVHEPVLLQEVIEHLNINADGNYVDATFGRGGHSRAILENLGPQGRLIALDRDLDAVAVAKERFADEPRFEIFHAAFSELKTVLTDLNLAGKVSGILLDLGVSSPQLEDVARGFSFSKEGPLDMRMDKTQKQTAATWLNKAREEEIADVIKTYGEERYARRIAKAIVTERKNNAIETTKQLTRIVTKACPTRERDKSPATRTFLAIRIFINKELEEVKQVLPQAVDVLKKGGRLCVISFHSLEDRIVKRFMREQARGPIVPKHIPLTQGVPNPRLSIIQRVIRPSPDEMLKNPRARSALLRVGEKVV